MRPTRVELKQSIVEKLGFDFRNGGRIYDADANDMTNEVETLMDWIEDNYAAD